MDGAFHPDAGGHLKGDIFEGHGRTKQIQQSKGRYFCAITGKYFRNNAKLPGSFAEMRNVCIFALPKYRSSPGFGPGSQRRHRRYGRGGADFRLGLCCTGTDGFSCWSDGRVARQRSAKPCTAVRVRFRPHRNRVANICNAVFFLFCHAFVIRPYENRKARTKDASFFLNH